MKSRLLAFAALALSAHVFAAASPSLSEANLAKIGKHKNIEAAQYEAAKCLFFGKQDKVWNVTSPATAKVRSLVKSVA